MEAIIESLDGHWYQVMIGRNDPVYFSQSDLADAIAYAKKRTAQVFVDGAVA